jgi:23S rRNA pseudoU1915 N3-methylase RlmH
LELVRLKPSKIGDPNQIRFDETVRICEVLKKRKAHCFLLDEIGKQQTTLEFAERLQRDRDAGKNIAFVIGGAYGVDKAQVAPYISSTF